VSEPRLSTPSGEVVEALVRAEADEAYRRSRQPSDLLRLLVAVVVAITGYAVARAFHSLGAGASIEIVEIVDTIPDPIVVTLVLGLQLLALVVPVATVVLLLTWRRYRRLLLGVASATLAVIAAMALSAWIDAYLADPALELVPPSWICSDAAASGACLPGDGFPSAPYLAAIAAVFSSLAPWLDRRWRTAGWTMLTAFAVVRLLDGTVAPVDTILMVAVGYALGAAVLLAFGAPDRTPQRSDVARALLTRELAVVDVARIGDEPNHPRRYRATLDDGARLFVKVRGPEERAAEILYRLYRMIRLRGSDGERPLSSLRREVEHEAGISLQASAAGVPTPQMLALAPVPPTSMLVAHEELEATALDAADGDDITDEALMAMWKALAMMRRSGIAHRHLSAANVLVARSGDVWFVDFGFAEAAAADGDLRGDVAQLLATTAVVVGSRRAVDAAVAGLGKDAVAAAAPRLQALALSSSTRTSLKSRKGLLDELRSDVMAATGIEAVELEKLERVTSRTVVMTVMLGLAFYFLIPQLAQVDLAEVAGADWRWFPLVLFFSAMTYVGASVALMGAMPVRLKLLQTLMAQVAASFFNRIAPAKVGGIAANIRYLQKSGVDPTEAIAGVGLNNVAGVAVHISLVAIFVTMAGRSASDAISLPSGGTVLIGLVVVMTLAGGVMVLPWGRRIWLHSIWPVLRKSLTGIASVASNPVKLLMLIGGAFFITMSYVMALWYSMEAFGGGLGFVAVAAIYLAGSALAQVAPTPGGVGAAEAALIAGMTAFGLEATIAVPSVFLFRLATFWLPVLPGYLAYRRLAARDRL
jgi:uncharacterized membrane protein YbhN (UPF0104 family)/tRNA A-37 threonylcarbamoyl transferase component Bud32